nr:DEAD/DEAH box helicase [Ardenticatena sp.]
MTFQQFSFDSRIERGIAAAGFHTPTPIQAEAIPHILNQRDVLGLAQTGTGKTAAFVLPILHRLQTKANRRPRALVVAPTRELAEQIEGVFRTLGRYTRVRSLSVYGGVSKRRQAAILRRGVDVIVACPGRLLDHLRDGAIDLRHVETLVLDEADRMCDMGFLPDIHAIIQQLPTQRQTLLFSATMPRDIRTLVEAFMRNPITVQIGQTAPVASVSHAIYTVHPRAKADLLLAWLQRTTRGRVLIFTRTKRGARDLTHTLRQRGHAAAALEGDMSQRQRQRAIDGFRRGRHDILVATDVAARGIDVPGITHVINFDLPDTVDAYTHRIGRTGRADATGEAISFVSRHDRTLVRAIEKTLGERLERRWMEGAQFDSPPPPRRSRRRTA